VDPRNYRHLRRGDIIVSLAGVATNLLLALLIVAFIALVGLVARALPAVAPYFFLLQVMAAAGIFFNLLLAVFNLMPIPPLDGSHVMKYLLPPKWSLAYQRIGGAGILIIMLLLFIRSPVIYWWLSPVFILSAFAADLLAPLLVPGAWGWWLPMWRP
jgi:Zn-dependent protease